MIMNRLHYLIDMTLFRPKEILNTYTDLNIKDLKDRGFKAVLLDIDNTIAVPNTGKCDDKAKQFISDLQNNGFEVVIFSNNNEERVRHFLDDLDVKYVYYALKPLPFSYIKTCKKLNIKPSETIVLGDQLMTDILGANLSGCYGIYTKRLQEKDSFLTSINRKMENFIWRHILHEEV